MHRVRGGLTSRENQMIAWQSSVDGAAAEATRKHKFVLLDFFSPT